MAISDTMLDGLDLDNYHRTLVETLEYMRMRGALKQQGGSMTDRDMVQRPFALKRAMAPLVKDLAALGKISAGSDYEVHDGPNGRVINRKPKDAQAAARVQLYDVVATNGLTWNSEEDFVTVEQNLGGCYARIARNLTEAEVNSTAFHWGWGTVFTDFGCAAVYAGAFCDPSRWKADLEHHNLPEEIVAAFAYDLVEGPGGVTLALKIGTIKRP